MDWRRALRARLQADDGVRAQLLGGPIDWGERAQRQGVGGSPQWVPAGRAFPAVRLSAVSDRRGRHMTGVDRWRGVRVQVDCMTLKMGATVALREAVLAVLLTPAERDGVRFGRAQSIEVRDLSEAGAEGFIYRDAIDAVIWTDG